MSKKKKKKKNGKKKAKLFGRTLKDFAKKFAEHEEKRFKWSRESGQRFIDLSKSISS